MTRPMTSTRRPAAAARPAPVLASVLVPVLAPVLAVVLAGCGSGTDRAVPGPTLPTVGASTSSPAGAASVEPAVASSAGTTAGTTPADPAVEPTPAGGAPDAVAPSGSGTATAGLMAGFPTDVIPVLPGATVTASAVRTSGDRLEVSLSGTSKRSADTILAFYDKAFRKQGFESTDGRTLAPGTGGRIYARGDEVLLVAVEGAGARRSFSVGGTVQR
ncbi:hypothetical protein [Kineosporia sp. R_H_3]|uniref:hypothetical protein n=1 Tax=Kineosporia sp. R_H_3 TaxID=1961848 RepID=UPI00130459CC|nr:hypothetical protein [Kineosporia sp. R_H_3]